MDIPSIEDHVSKLEHMGKETVKKLQDIHGAAMQVGRLEHTHSTRTAQERILTLTSPHPSISFITPTQVGIEIDIPENCIQRVGDFKLLALRAEQVGAGGGVLCPGPVLIFPTAANC